MNTPNKFTKDEIARWRAEALDHERQAEMLTRRARAAEMYMATLASESDRREPNAGHEISVHEGDAGNFMGAIRRIANASTKPIPKAEMKFLLLKEGYPPKQVGSTYFYVALKKLSTKEQISIQADGAIGKGKKP